MSAETAPRKKRNVSDTTPAPDGDHRKRRRNRTTQSCLNCHTSKRMCDRKRPACARCTQLGLTGLCVYEVDDPSQRVETQDESSRLIKRVAELEGVIRELKNKPHPRWVQSNQPGSDESCSSNAPSPPISSSSSERGDSSPRRSSSTNPTTPPKSGLYSLSIQPSANYESRRKSPYLLSPLESTPSPGLMTPTDEYPFSPAGIAGQGAGQDYDLTSMLLNYPGLMGFNDGSFPPVNEARPNKQHSGGCSCLHDPASYNTMLELSLRLRKASDILGQSSSHHNGGYCHLHQRISELDSFTINALSDITPSPRAMVDSNQAGFHPSQIYSQRMPSTMRGPSLNVRPWDLMPSSANSPAPLDDSFMSWEPPRRS
ncbi:hypothetical protein CVT25_005829 [Psilocybe cyanescens]|uniref:Zn(2)-C6 fungal-type domain-containing protein n=1 Tax=Psilocybe cyanescens TaxID=93625 RepID=A0A409VLU3_PSICY|nr:hypothetical protein CVT25_005829 [Psilocybe cyanescens]